jgi:NAD(P)-dependent dehydrogenase (short-subunit alcohol dehydrogenase family)
MLLEGKVAIVTGGGSGIGRSACHLMAKEGARVAVVDIRRDRADQVAGDIALAGETAIAIAADVGLASPVDQMLEDVLRAFGGVDILVNNAGILRLGKVVDTSETDWDDVLRANLKSVFLCSRAVARQMIEQGRGGKIVNVSSIHARLSEPNAGAYAASKGGIDAITLTLASELAPYAINVNCVAPGAVFTQLGGSQFQPEDVPHPFAPGGQTRMDCAGHTLPCVGFSALYDRVDAHDRWRILDGWQPSRS